MVNALQCALTKSQHLFCMLHCKDNVIFHLTKVGVATEQRERVLQLLFGTDGCVFAGDEITIENRTGEVVRYVRQNNIDAVEYFQSRILPKIASNCRLQWKESCLGQSRWTNNNAESANNLLKAESQDRLETGANHRLDQPS